jgi:hypothetical protein
MNSALIVRKVVERLAKELKSSNMHPSDADWYIGFGDDVNTANEEVVGDRITYLQHWDGDNVGYVEEEEERDSGGGIARVVMQQITPIK